MSGKDGYRPTLLDRDIEDVELGFRRGDNFQRHHLNAALDRLTDKSIDISSLRQSSYFPGAPLLESTLRELPPGPIDR